MNFNRDFQRHPTKHKNESAEICEELGILFKKNCYWLQYRHLPDRLRRALKAYHVANTAALATDGHRWRYFLAILKNTI